MIHLSLFSFQFFCGKEVIDIMKMVEDNWYLLISIWGKLAISPRSKGLVQPTRYCFSRRTQATMLRQSCYKYILVTPKTLNF